MRNSHQVDDGWLDEMGGDSLEGSGFETETPDRVYSNDPAPGTFRSANKEEPTDVH